MVAIAVGTVDDDAGEQIAAAFLTAAVVAVAVAVVALADGPLDVQLLQQQHRQAKLRLPLLRRGAVELDGTMAATEAVDDNIATAAGAVVVVVVVVVVVAVVVVVVVVSAAAAAAS